MGCVDAPVCTSDVKIGYPVGVGDTELVKVPAEPATPYNGDGFGLVVS
ncbi:MAG: hypothetical protein ACI9E1_001449 [Cryomorphaceae bacterium]|jgi:hypothetical protein